MSTTPTTAAKAALIRCHACEKLSRMRRLPSGYEARCSRCSARLQQRKSNSLSRTWALVITAAILYIPANIFPIMTVEFFGQPRHDTILSGVQALFESGQYPIAIVVFFASIAVPMLKLFGLVYLLLSIQLKWKAQPRQRTALYRVIEVVGRWSMIDMFMVSILVSLVKLGSVATIEPGLGATAFAGVVVVTMFAASSFDPQLIWDHMEDETWQKT